MKCVTRAYSRILLALAVCACLACAVLACSCSSDPRPEQGAHLEVASMKGPTSIGLAALMQQEADASESLYNFTVQGTADAIVPLIVQGKVDIALLPANLAATLYQKTSGGICVIDVNTLGVLYGVSQRTDVDTVESLRGLTLYMTGKGTVPQYTLDALLAAAGMTESDLRIEFKSEPAEVVAAISADAGAVGILPQPYVTAATMKNPSLSVTLDLTALWQGTMGSDAGKLITGVTVVRREVLEAYPKAVARFLSDHASSVERVNKDPKSAAAAVVAAGIVDNEQIAAQAIPACNVVCLTGADMKKSLSGYLEVLFAQNAASVGGSLPGDDFYWVG